MRHKGRRRENEEYFLSAIVTSREAFIRVTSLGDVKLVSCSLSGIILQSPAAVPVVVILNILNLHPFIVFQDRIKSTVTRKTTELSTRL